MHSPSFAWLDTWYSQYDGRKLSPTTSGSGVVLATRFFPALSSSRGQFRAKLLVDNETHSLGGERGLARFLI